MIKFFRKIRHNLLSEGKSGKYFKYAIGEIVLVVIGILIALQINNWNEDKKERRVEKELIDVLITDLQSKKEEFISDLEIGKSIIKDSDITINHWRQSGKIDTFKLKELLSIIGTDGWLFEVNSPIYATISGSGLWKQLPDSLIQQMDNVYRLRFSSIKIAFDKQVKYGTNSKLNFLAPNHLLDLNRDVNELQIIVQDNDDEFISCIELFKSGVIDLTTNFENTIPIINNLIKNLATYRNTEK